MVVEKFSLKLKVVLKYGDAYIGKYVRVLSVMSSLNKLREFLNGWVLNDRDHCTLALCIINTKLL